MSDRGGTAQQSSIPEQARLGAEHLWLALSVVSFTVVAVALFVEQYTSVQVLRGGYSILTGLFVAGCIGWVVGATERRMRRDVGKALVRLREGQVEVRASLAELRDQVAHQRVAYIPAPRQPSDGQRYISSAAVSQGDTVPLAPSVNPEAEAALRRINMRLVQNDDLL